MDKSESLKKKKITGCLGLGGEADSREPSPQEPDSDGRNRRLFTSTLGRGEGEGSHFKMHREHSCLLYVVCSQKKLFRLTISRLVRGNLLEG